MTNNNKDNEFINLLELESNTEDGNKVTCPKCSNDTLIKRKIQIYLGVQFLEVKFRLLRDKE